MIAYVYWLSVHTLLTYSIDSLIDLSQLKSKINELSDRIQIPINLDSLSINNNNKGDGNNDDDDDDKGDNKNLMEIDDDKDVQKQNTKSRSTSISSSTSSNTTTKKIRKPRRTKRRIVSTTDDEEEEGEVGRLVWGEEARRVVLPLPDVRQHEHRQPLSDHGRAPGGRLPDGRA